MAILHCSHEADLHDQGMTCGSCNICYCTTFYTCAACEDWVCEMCILPPNEGDTYDVDMDLPAAPQAALPTPPPLPPVPPPPPPPPVRNPVPYAVYYVVAASVMLDEYVHAYGEPDRNGYVEVVRAVPPAPSAGASRST